MLVLPGAVGFDIAGNTATLAAGETKVFEKLASVADVSAAEMEDRIQQLGKQLGAPSFSQRESAERRLVEIGVPARAALERLTGSDDPEVARRARSALAAIGVQQRAEELQKYKDRVNEFIACGKGSPALWPLFEESIASGKDGREIFGALVLSEPQLFLLLELASAPGRSDAEADDLAAEFRSRFEARWRELREKNGSLVQQRIAARDFPYLRPLGTGGPDVGHRAVSAPPGGR